MAIFLCRTFSFFSNISKVCRTSRSRCSKIRNSFRKTETLIMADLTQKREKSGKPNKQPIVTGRQGRNLIQLIECRKSVRLLLRLPKKPRKHDAPFLFISASSCTLTIAIPPLLLQAAIPKVLYRNQIPFLNNSTGCHKITRKIWSISVFRSSKNGSKPKPIQPMVRTECRTLRRREFKITRLKI